MKIAILGFTNDDARYIIYLLRKRYGKDRRTGLSKLCMMAVRTGVATLAQQNLDKVERLIEKCKTDTQQDDEEQAIKTDQEGYVFVIRSGTGYLVRFTEGDLLLVTAEPVGATRVKRSMADSLMSKMVQLGFEAELLEVKFSLAKNKVYYESVKD